MVNYPAPARTSKTFIHCFQDSTEKNKGKVINVTFYQAILMSTTDLHPAPFFKKAVIRNEKGLVPAAASACFFLRRTVPLVFSCLFQEASSPDVSDADLQGDLRASVRFLRPILSM